MKLYFKDTPLRITQIVNLLERTLGPSGKESWYFDKEFINNEEGNTQVGFVYIHDDSFGMLVALCWY